MQAFDTVLFVGRYCKLKQCPRPLEVGRDFENSEDLEELGVFMINLRIQSISENI